MTFEEVRQQALESRKNSAQNDTFDITQGETYRGEHLITNVRGKQYTVTLHDPENEKGHCTCTDFNSNHLGTCKHFIHLITQLKRKKNFSKRIKKERFPFVHLYWDSVEEKPRYYYDRHLSVDLADAFEPLFDSNGLYKKGDIAELYHLIEKTRSEKIVKVDGHIIKKIENSLLSKAMDPIKESHKSDFSVVNANLYPYQQDGVDFALFKRSAIIADEMGLGKTLQAITLSLLKKKLFNFEKVLVITPASLKEQWKREI